MDFTGIYIGVIACVLLAGVALNRFSRFLKMPILLCFLGVGIVCGPHGLDIFPAFNLDRVQFFGELALAFIIFSGGLNTSFSAIKKVFVTGTILATVGVVLTAVIFAGCIYWECQSPLWPSITFLEALLIGSIFSSTDAAAVFAILRSQKAAISPNLQSLLEYESGSNDPAAFLLTTLIGGAIWSHTEPSFTGISWSILTGILWGLGAGACIGFLFGLFGQWFYNWIQSFLEYNGLRFVVAVAIVLLAFGCNDAFFHANSLMICYVAGITMGNLHFHFKQNFIRFHDGISWLMQILLFSTLGSYFDYHRFFHWKTILSAVIAAMVMMFIARPLSVMLCMIKSPFNMRERIITSWVGIRGSAPIMLAILVLASSPGEKIGEQNLFYMVFVVVLLSIVFQGSSIMWVAKKLNLLLPYKEAEEIPLEYTEKADEREMQQFVIAADSPLIDQRLDDGGLEENGPILLMIKRGAQFIQPRPGLRLKQGDALSFLGERDAMRDLHRRYFPQEEYISSPTFRQLWRKMQRYIFRRFRKSAQTERA